MRDTAAGSGRGARWLRPQTNSPKQNGGRHCCRPPLSPLLARWLSGACANARLAAVPCPLDPSFRTGFLRSALPLRSVLQAGASCSAQPSVVRSLLVRAAWAWQSLVPLPPAARCRASGCCGRVSFFAPSGTAPSGAALARLAFGRTVPPVKKGPFRAGLACCPSRRFRWIVPPVLRPSALPHPPCFGTPFRHPEPVFPVCNPPFTERASARWNWFQCKLFSPVRSENFCFQISALRLFLQTSFPFRQGRCCASFLSRTSAKMRSYPQAAQGLVDNFASREKGLRF